MRDGVAFSCDYTGAITGVIHNGLSLSGVFPGRSLASLVHDPDQAASFLNMVASRKGVVNGELYVQVSEQVLILHCVGMLNNGDILIAGAPLLANAVLIFEEYFHIRLENTGLPLWDETLLDEMTRQNNMLINLQRELVKNNIRLEQEIDSRKRVEEELHLYRDHLEEMVSERSAKLKAMNVDLLQINKELESFCYSVSHDLSSPLRIINGYSHFLLEDYQDQLDLEGSRKLQVINSQCQRMSDLIRGLLELSHLSHKEMQPEKVDLSRMAMSTATMLKKRDPERLVDFIAAPNLETQGDNILLHSMLENLISNAWKFTSKKESARIEFGTTLVSRKKTYFIRDNGIGFDMKYAQKLFSPFQRLHSSEEFPGTGIGLAIVKRIIERHGGRIWAEGVEGQGATFYFTLNKEKTGEK